MKTEDESAAGVSHETQNDLPDRSFYVIVDDRYFVGAVALVNSLRLVGHGERIVALACGLDDRKQKLLGREAAVLEAPPLPSTTAAFLLRSRAPMAEPAQAMILLDADLVATRSLEPVFELVHQGQMVAFADALSDRFSELWQQELALESVRRQTYVNTGLLGLPAERGLRLLGRLEELQPTADTSRTFWSHGVPEDPFYFLDQDILNALLSSEFRADEMTVLPHRLAPHPPFEGLSVDRRSLHCRYSDGTEPFLLHHVLRKPWLHPVAPNLYSELLPRLLLEPDLAIRLDKRDVPSRFRSTLVGRAVRTGVALSLKLTASRRAATEVLRSARPGRKAHVRRASQ